MTVVITEKVRLTFHFLYPNRAGRTAKYKKVEIGKPINISEAK